MIAIRHTVALVALVTLTSPAVAAETSHFVVRLGRDTVGVERDVREAGRVVVDQGYRSPRVLRRHYEYEYADGALTRLTAEVTAPGSPAPIQSIAATFDADSMHLSFAASGGKPNLSALAMKRGTLVVASASPWAGYDGALRRFVASHADSSRGTMYFLGAPATDWYTLERLGTDSVIVRTGHLDVFHAAVGRDGALLGVLPISGTAKFSVQRVASLDVDAMTASFAAQEKAGSGLGMLSPRDTVRVGNAGGASLWVDYGRPAKRGRVVYGGIVPYGEVWRTGANAATQFRTDKSLDFGGTVVPAGFYTLWTVPSPDGWKLVVNGETGQWGTEHKSAKDLYTIAMTTSALPAEVERFTIGIEGGADGGVMNLDWDRTRAAVSFKVVR